jgi:DNA-binding PadR family transcriptional regulator
VPDINATAAAALGFLHNGPMTGWQLAQAVEVSLCDFFNVTRSQVYKELRALAAAELVEAGETGPRDRRPYTITAAGRAAFSQWLHADPAPEIMRSPFHLKLFFANHLDSSTLERFVRKYREHNEERLAYYRALEPTIEKVSPNGMHVLRYGIAARETALRWIDTLPWGSGKQGSHGAKKDRVKAPRRRARR